MGSKSANDELEGRKNKNANYAIGNLMKEANELTAIFTASIKTARIKR